MSAQQLSASHAAEHRLEVELIQLLARQGRHVPVPVFLSALLIASMAFSSQGGWSPWLWLSAVVFVLALRWKVLGALPSLHRLTSAEKLKVAVLLSAANGVVHGASMVFAPSLDGLERAVQSILLLGLCSGSVATTGGYRPVFVAFVAPTLLSLSAMWAAASSSSPEHRWIEVSMAVLVLLFGMVLVSLAKDTFRLLTESFEIRREQAGLNIQLRAALEEAEAANRAKTRFLASASHDLRQPLHTLSLFGAALTMRPLDDGSRQIAHHMNTALRSLGAQLDALLDVSKLDAGVVPINKMSFSLADFFRQLHADCLPMAEQKGLLFSLHCPPQACCETDELLLGRVVRNLVENAIKYTPSGYVAVEVHAEGGNWMLRIRDSGVGIPEAEHQRVFEEFYQIDNPERDRACGLGLGLSIVRRLVQLLGLGMAMDSKPGIGTEFSITVPSAQHGAPVAQGRDESAAQASLAGIRVLVLDDEEAVRQGMQTLLLAHGCSVLLAGSIDEALEQAGRERPDLVLADLRLRHGENGIDAIGELRRRHGRLPAILISGDTAPLRLRDAHAAEVRMLHKPVSAESLRDAIAQELTTGDDHGGTR